MLQISTLESFNLCMIFFHEIFKFLQILAQPHDSSTTTPSRDLVPTIMQWPWSQAKPSPQQWKDGSNAFHGWGDPNGYQPGLQFFAVPNWYQIILSHCLVVQESSRDPGSKIGQKWEMIFSKYDIKWNTCGSKHEKSEMSPQKFKMTARIIFTMTYGLSCVCTPWRNVRWHGLK